jgi:histidinol-phosphate aminotransferase
MSFAAIANRFVCDIPVYEAGRPIEEVARELGLNPRRIIKLASNENPLGPSPKAVAAMRRALPASHLYPDGGAYYLRRALAKKLGVTPDRLVLGTGSNEVIEFIYHAFVAPGDEVVVGERAFVIYKFMAVMFQARCVETPSRGHTHDLRAMREAITARTKLVFLDNPNNPTGTRVINADLARFVRELPPHVLLVLDEAYYEFLQNPPPSIEYAMRHNVIVLRTFSKIAGLAGLRVGYGVARPECVALLEKVRQPFNLTSVGQAGALAALADAAHIRRTRRVVDQGRDYLQGQFHRLGLEHTPGCANFVLVKVGDGGEVFRALQQRGIIVRPMAGYNMPEWIRVSVGLPDQNRRLVTALGATLGKT